MIFIYSIYIYEEKNFNYKVNVLSENEPDEFSSSEAEQLSQDLKRSLSFVATVEDEKKIKTKDETFSFPGEFFAEYVPFWGGLLIDEKGEKTDFLIRNTCTIDYFLFAIWCSSKLSKNAL